MEKINVQLGVKDVNQLAVCLTLYVSTFEKMGFDEKHLHDTIELRNFFYKLQADINK